MFMFEVGYTGHGPDFLILRGPASCRRCSKQSAKNKSVVYCVCLHSTNAKMTSTFLSPGVDYYNDEEDLDSVDDDDDRSFRGRGSEEGNVLNQLTKVLARSTFWKREENVFLYGLSSILSSAFEVLRCFYCLGG